MPGATLDPLATVLGLSDTGPALAPLQDRHTHFHWRNFSTHSATLRDLANALRQSRLRLPRTGHLGNWTDSANCVAGSLDYNGALCRDLRLAYPLVFDLNQTECRTAVDGDTIYLPGSLVRQGRRRRLSLLSWDRSSFQPVPNDLPRFAPFLRVRESGVEAPLTEFHRNSIRRSFGPLAHFQSDLIRQQLMTVRSYLLLLVTGALESPRAQRLWETLADRTVDRAGLVRRRRSHVTQRGVQIGDQLISAPRDIVDSLLLPLEVAADPCLWHRRMAQLPEECPLLSNHAVYALLVLCAPQFRQTCRTLRPVALHLQWGAIGLAGVPPVKRSYFENNRKRVRSLFDLLSMHPNAPGGFLGVLPSPPLLLLPPADYATDSQLVAELCARFRHASLPGTAQPARRAALIRGLVESILGPPESGRVSRYFAARFRHFRSPLHGCSVPEQWELAVLPEVMDLTLAAATELTGHLWRHFRLTRRIKP